MAASAKPKVLVTGAAGQVGFELCRKLGIERVISKPREALDITNLQHINSWLPTLRPDVIVNCAAFTDVELAEKQRDKCWQVNTQAVHNLIGLCNKNSIPLIHISSSHVFGQDYFRKVPYSEEDATGPLGVYGQSKCSAEHAILSATRGCSPDGGLFDCGGWWVLRASALYERPWRPYRNFPQLMISLSDNRRGSPLEVVDDVYTTPTYVPHFVEAIIHVINNLTSFPWGIYHVANRGRASWYDFARRVGTDCNKTIEVAPTSKDTYYRRLGLNPDLCPSYTVMNTDKFAEAAGFDLPPWEDGVAQFCRAWNRNN